MLIQKILSVTFFLVFLAAKEAPAAAGHERECQRLIHGANVKNDNIELGEFEPSISKLWQEMSEEEKIAAKTHLLEGAGYAVEPVPFALNPMTWRFLKEASIQRARAAKAFLEDVYRNKHPYFIEEHPEMQEILESSKAFIDELVGTEAIRNVPFDFSMAMDSVLVRDSEGRNQFRILESDTGAIGGNIRLAQIAHGLYEIWPKLIYDGRYQDSREYLFQRMSRAVELGLQKSGESNPTVLMYTEEDPAFLPGKNSVVQDWFHRFGISTVSSWTKSQIVYDPVKAQYTLDGRPVAHIWLDYYQGQLDPQLPSFKKLPASLREDPYELGHAIPEFWLNWIQQGYKNWSQWNIIGAELFCDKAISAFLPEMIRTYLNEEPLIDGQNYRIFKGINDFETRASIDKVFAHQNDYVVKNRAPVGGGAEVYIGRFMKDGKKNNLTWQELKREVEKSPLDWVYQEFLSEEALVLPDGRQRSFELRTIVNVDDGTAYPVNGVYIRSAAIGNGRNLTGSRDQVDPASVIPVLVPQEDSGSIPSGN